MFRSVLLDKEAWTEHLKLDPVTGLDPPGIKIRAAQGNRITTTFEQLILITVLYRFRRCRLFCYRASTPCVVFDIYANM